MRNIRKQFVAVEPDDRFPLTLGDLNTMGDAVEHDLVDHSMPRSASSRPSVFQFELFPPAAGAFPLRRLLPLPLLWKKAAAMAATFRSSSLLARVRAFP